MPVGDILRFQFGYAVNGQSVSNVIHAEMTDAPPSTDETDDAATAFVNSIIDELQKILSNEAQLCFIKVHTLQSALPPTRSVR